jgi:hypothetical protein
MSNKIYAQISAIMEDVDAIGKDRKNQGQGYSFRGIDDVYNSLHAVLAKHRVFTVPEVLEDRTEDRTNAKGTTLIYRVLKIKYHFFADDGSSITATVIGEGMDSGDKASNKAMSVAHKYALLQVFAIPTEESKDPEEESHEIRPQVYLPTGQQKRWFAELCKKHGLDNKEAMAKLSNECSGKPLSSVEEHIKKHSG